VIFQNDEREIEIFFSFFIKKWFRGLEISFGLSKLNFRCFKLILN